MDGVDADADKVAKLGSSERESGQDFEGCFGPHFRPSLN